MHVAKGGSHISLVSAAALALRHKARNAGSESEGTGDGQSRLEQDSRSAPPPFSLGLASKASLIRFLSAELFRYQIHRVPCSTVQSSAQSHSFCPPNQHMPPTPPPIVTSTTTAAAAADPHPPNLNHPDARHNNNYQQPLSSQQQPGSRAKDDESSRFDFPLPPRAVRQQQTQDATGRQADGNTNIRRNHEGSDNNNDDGHGSNSRKPTTDSLPTPPAATASATTAATAAAAAADATIVADTAAVDPSVETDQLIASKTDDDYDILILKKATLYRRSGVSSTRAIGLVHRGIGVVKRDAAGGHICAGEIAAASATPGSGRLKEDELAGRYGALPWLPFIRSICCHPSIHTSTHPSTHPSIHLSIYPSIHLSLLPCLALPFAKPPQTPNLNPLPPRPRSAPLDFHQSPRRVCLSEFDYSPTLFPSSLLPEPPFRPTTAGFAPPFTLAV